jgi:hypothetical protein
VGWGGPEIGSAKGITPVLYRLLGPRFYAEQKTLFTETCFGPYANPSRETDTYLTLFICQLPLPLHMSSGKCLWDTFDVR